MISASLYFNIPEWIVFKAIDYLHLAVHEHGSLQKIIPKVEGS